MENADFLSKQLITYLGNKRALLGFIGLIIALPLTTLIISYYCEYVLHEPNPLRRRLKPKKPLDVTRAVAIKKD